MNNRTQKNIHEIFSSIYLIYPVILNSMINDFSEYFTISRARYPRNLNLGVWSRTLTCVIIKDDGSLWVCNDVREYQLHSITTSFTSLIKIYMHAGIIKSYQEGTINYSLSLFWFWSHKVVNLYQAKSNMSNHSLGDSFALVSTPRRRQRRLEWRQ